MWGKVTANKVGKIWKAGKEVRKGEFERIELINRLDNVKFSKKAYSRLEESWRFVPVSLLKEVIISWKKLPDPKWSSANMYYYTIWKNWKKYNVEVLYDEESNTIWHFLYTNKWIWPLSPIK